MSTPNCLVFVIDSLRYDHTSLSGYHRDTTPNLATLARDAVIYENFYTVATWTRPVASSILSGVYPPVHKVRHRDSYFAYNGPRLPSILQQAGYETKAISGIGQVSTFAGFAEGFTNFEDAYRDRQLLNKRTQISGRDAKLLERGVGEIALIRTEDLVELFQNWWQSRSNPMTPFFSLIWSLDPHPPFEPPKEFVRFGTIDEKEYAIDAIRGTRDISAQINLYDAEILYTDHWVGKLIEYLRKEDIYDNTLLIFVADHGEAWGEHGFVGHGQAPYDELLHVPLIIKHPSNKYGGTRVNELADMTDLTPTIIAELLGEDVLDELSPAFQGFSLKPTKWERTWPRQVSFSDTAPTPFQPSYWSVRTSQWKAIVPSRAFAYNNSMRRSFQSLYDLLTGTNLWKELLKHPLYFFKKYVAGSLSPKQDELYHLPNDPGELQNQLNNAPEIYDDLKRKFEQWQQECQTLSEAVPETTRDFERDDFMREHLRALGYVD